MSPRALKSLRLFCLFLAGLLAPGSSPGSEAGDRFDEALAHFREGEYREALEIVAAIEREHPDRVVFGEENLFNFKGSCLTALRYFQHARKEFSKALEAQPDSFDMKYNLAEMDFLQEHFDSAIKEFDALKRTDRGRLYSDFLDYKIGMCLIMEGKEARVQENLEIHGRNTPIYIFLTTAIALREDEVDKAEVLLLLARERIESEVCALYEDSLIECGLMDPPALPGAQQEKLAPLLRRPLSLGTGRLYPKARSEAAGDPVDDAGGVTVKGGRPVSS